MAPPFDFGPAAPAPAPPPAQPPAPGILPRIAEKMRDEAEQLYEDARSAILERVPMWQENAAYYKGLQWGYSTPLGYHVDPDDATEEERQTLNLIESFVRTIAADLLRHIPNPEVVAGADDPDQVARADASYRILRMLTAKNIIDFRELERLVIGAQVFGEGYIRASFDPDRGRSQKMYVWRQDTATGQWVAELDVFGQQRVERQFEGELKIEYVDVFHTFPDPTAPRFDDARYVTELTEMSVGAARNKFPTDYLGNPSRWAPSATAFDEASLRTIDEGVMQATLGTALRSPDNAIVKIKRLYERPSRDYPNGRFVCWTDGCILAVGPLEVWPWVKLDGQGRGFGAHSAGVVQGLKSSQRLYNRGMTVLASTVDAQVPGMIAPRGSKFDLDNVSNVPGWFGEYTPGYKPEPYIPPQLPNNLFMWTDHILAAMKTTSTISDVSRGEMPVGAESARALAYLHEFEQGVRGPEVQLFRLVLIDLMRTLLRLAERHYRDGRMIVTLGRDNAWQEEIFHRDGVDFDADLVIEPMSGAPTSKALRQDEIIRAVQFGVLQPQQAARMLEYDTADRNSYSPEASARSEARRENHLWRSNPYTPQIEAVAGENHLVHLEEHNKERTTRFYKDLPPEARAAIDMHYQHHLYHLASQVQGMASLLAMAQAQEQASGGTAGTLGGGQTAAPEMPGEGMPPGMPPSANTAPATAQG